MHVRAAADVWLGPDASRCLVSGGRTTTTVCDQGTYDTLANVTPVTAALLAAPASRSIPAAGPCAKAKLMKRF